MNIIFTIIVENSSLKNLHLKKRMFDISGREEGQLWYPRKVAVMRDSGKYVVCDRGCERSRMQLFNKSGHFVKKIAIRYIDIVAGLAITPQGVYSWVSSNRKYDK